MAGITLSAAVRDSLLSLQTTTQLINRTQGRLSTGLAVSPPSGDRYYDASEAGTVLHRT